MKILNQQEKVENNVVVLTQQVEQILTQEDLEQSIMQCKRLKTQYLSQLQKLKEAYNKEEENQKEYERLLEKIPPAIDINSL